MIVGVPKEIKADEYRVALIPVGAEELRRRGHREVLERGAGHRARRGPEQAAPSVHAVAPSACWVR